MSLVLRVCWVDLRALEIEINEVKNCISLLVTKKQDFVRKIKQPADVLVEEAGVECNKPGESCVQN